MSSASGSGCDGLPLRPQPVDATRARGGGEEFEEEPLSSGDGAHPSASSGPRLRRVAWLVDGHDSYGLARTVEVICERLAARRGYPIIVCIDEGPFAADLRRRGWLVRSLGRTHAALRVHRPPSTRIEALRRAIALTRLAADVAASLKDLHVDALVCRTGALAGLCGAAARSLGAEAWWYMANTVPGGVRGLASRLYYDYNIYRSDIHVIANSQCSRDSLGAAASRALVIPPPVDLAPFLRVSELRGVAAAGHAPRKGNFGMFARLVKWKGQLPFVRAFLAVAKSAQLGDLVVVGDGDRDYLMQLQSVVRADANGAKVRFLGRVERPEEVMREVDVVVCPSIEPEPYGRVCVEAQAAARPVLASAIGGHTETVLDGVTGWLFPGTDEHAMAEAIGRALQDQLEWIEMGAAARRHVADHFDGQVLADRFIDAVYGGTAA